MFTSSETKRKQSTASTVTAATTQSDENLECLFENAKLAHGSCAKELLEMPTSTNYLAAAFCARLYFHGCPTVPKSLEKASSYSLGCFAQLVEAANNGNAVAQCNLGKFFLDGIGVTKDEACAADWLSRASAQGNLAATVTLGDMHFFGKWTGKPADVAEAIRLYKIAADRGHVIAMYNMGVAYRDGLGGLTVDLDTAAGYFSIACQFGHTGALCNLAEMYREGYGVPKDKLKSSLLFKCAILRGATHVQASLDALRGEGLIHMAKRRKLLPADPFFKAILAAMEGSYKLIVPGFENSGHSLVCNPDCANALCAKQVPVVQQCSCLFRSCKVFAVNE